MKKEMKHALVALGLSTLLVPTFANQVVYAQEETNDDAIQYRLKMEKRRALIEKFKVDVRNYADESKIKSYRIIDNLNLKTLYFSDQDIKQLKEKVANSIMENLEKDLGEHDNEGFDYDRSILTFKQRLDYFSTHFAYFVLETAKLKKLELKSNLVRQNNLYTQTEKEEVINSLERLYKYLDYKFKNSPYPASYDETIEVSISRIKQFLSDDGAPIIAPTHRNIREINAVAFMEKTAISNDDTLSQADKVSMFSRIDDIVEDGVKNIKTEAGLFVEGYPKTSHMLSPEELSVFTKRIEDVYQGKAKPKVTKEEAIQAVSTVTSATVSSSSQSTDTSNGETKKDYQASKWFKESGKWYYNDLSGNLVRNRWVGRYYLKADASMAVSEWIYDEDYKSWFYVDSTGSYVEKAWQGEYYLKRGGYMAKSEWVFDSQYDSWYYLNQDGKYARNQWIKDGDKWYYLLADGKLAKNMTINGYKVNEKGEWV